MLHYIRLQVAREEYRESVRINRAEMRRLRNTSDPFQLTDQKFVDLFRLDKNLTNYLTNELQPYLKQSERITGIHPVTKVLTALMFYATGSYQRILGQAFLLSVSQQCASRIIKEVTEAIYDNIADNWITFPRTEEEKLSIKRRFMQKTYFPGVIGAIDCTHVAILKPSIEEHNYLNRKGYHSKNVQIICDYDTKILALNARYAGATHDSFIWRESLIHRELQNRYQEGDISSWLLGDSGYPQQPWLMTPFLNPLPNTPEERYNLRHASGRNCIERCNGILKTRFRCILGERKLRYSPEVTGKIITVCAVLHNMCITARLELREDLRVEIENDNLHVNNHMLGIDVCGNDARQHLLNLYFH